MNKFLSLLRHPQLFVWLLALAPAFVTLGLLIELRATAPHGDSWFIVEQYRQAVDGRFTWRDFVQLHNEHPVVPGRAIYFFVLHCCGGEVGLLPLATWTLSVLTSFGLLRLLVLTVPVRGWRLAVLWGLLNTLLFAPTHGDAWLWEFLVFNAFVVPCLVGGLCGVVSPAATRSAAQRALFFAAGPAALATVSLGSGALVPWLLLLAWLGRHAGQGLLSRRRLAGLGLAWSLFFLVFTGLVHGAWGGLVEPAVRTDAQSRLADVASRPVEVLHYVLVVLGFGLGQGTVVEPVAQATASTLVFALALFVSLPPLRFGAAGRWRAAAPWLILIAFAVGNAALIGWARFRFSFISALVHRYVPLTIPFAVAVIVLVVLAATHAPASPRAQWLRRQLPLLGGLLGGWIGLNWLGGWQAMKTHGLMISSHRAALSFTDVVAPAGVAIWPPMDQELLPPLIKWLEQRDALPAVRLLKDPSVSAARLRHPFNPNVARLTEWRTEPAGQVRVSGTCAVSTPPFYRPVLIALALESPQSHQWLALGFPDLTEDFFQSEWRRRGFREHYYRWTARFPVDLAPAPSGSILRAYAFLPEQQAFKPLSGDLPWPPPPGPAGMVVLSEPRAPESPR